MAQRLLDLNILGNYHLLLAHDVAHQPEEYSKVFNRLEKATLILDNSVIEMGIAAAPDIVRKAQKALCGGSNEVVTVLPDFLGDGASTAEASIAAGHEWPHKDIPGPYMVVPQGQTIGEFALCAKHLSHIPNVKWWGIPRYMVQTVGSRQRCIDICRELKPTWKIHLLGFSDDIIDDMAACRREEVVGIDSAVPLRMGMIGMPMSIDAMTDVVLPKRQEHWWEAASLYPFDETSTVANNVEVVRAWINKKPVTSL
jgi:hypothetical protein